MIYYSSVSDPGYFQAMDPNPEGNGNGNGNQLGLYAYMLAPTQGGDLGLINASSRRLLLAGTSRPT